MAAIDLVTRKGWGARAPRNRFVVPWSVRTEFFVHHTDGPTSQTIRSIQNFHMDGNGWSDIGYNHLVRDDGTIYEGRGWLVVGAHCPDHNRTGHSVAYIGDNAPTAAALRSIRWLYDEACRRAKRKLKMLGHGQRFATACPGTELQDWVNKGMPVVPPAAKPAPAVDHDDNPVPEFARTLRLRMPMMRGDDVRAWQAGARRFQPSLDVDGIYGADSRRAAETVQRTARMPINGVVDAETWLLTWVWEPEPPKEKKP